MDTTSPSEQTLPPWPVAEALPWQPTAAQQQQFQALFSALITLNQRVNLTRITSPTDFVEKHLWDSLCGVAPWLGTPDPALVIDVGTGGGFPGLPVALVQPHWQITLLDSTRKKIAALTELAEGLALSNVQPVADRAETYARRPDCRGQADLVLVRAVGPASTCAEYALPLLKRGGTAILYRGQWGVEDEATLLTALEQLGGTITDVRATHTPQSQGIRHYLELTKLKPTPARFPRGVGVPAKSPLGE